MPDLAAFGDSLDGELFGPDTPGYEAIRRPVNAAYREARPRLVVLCRSVADVAATLAYATATGDRIVPRGGGHCFAGRSSTDGIVLDLSGLTGVSVAADRVATIGAGVRCYAPDAGRAIALLTTAATLRHDTYNVSSGRPFTNREFADALQAITPGLRLDLRPGRRNGPGDDPCLDITRLAGETGFAPAFTLAEAVADYVAWRTDNSR